MRHFDAQAGVRCVSDSTVSVANSVHQKVAESMNHIQSSEHLSEKEEEGNRKERHKVVKEPQQGHLLLCVVCCQSTEMDILKTIYDQLSWVIKCN